MPINYVVTKANALIEASYRLSVGEQKLILLLASMIQPDDKEFKTYQISVKSCMEWLGVTNKNKYKQIEKITKDLMTKVLVVHKEKSTLQISWISSAEYFKGQGIVELCFDPKLKPYLLQLKENFTTYRLKNIVQLKSYYSIRIYELLKQYEKIKERSFTLQELRDVLGIQKKQYPQYANFKQKVLKVAFEEINEKTDLTFKFEEIKKGRKVEKIKFFIKSQKKVSMEDAVLEEVAVTLEKDEKEIVYTEALNKMIKEKLTKNETKAILNVANYDMNKIKEKYEIAKVSKYTNLVAFLISAITNNYQSPQKNKISTNQFNNFKQHDTKYTDEELEKLIRWK